MKKVAILIPTFRPNLFFKDLFPVLQIQIDGLISEYNYDVEIIIAVPDDIDLEIYGNALKQECLRVLRTAESGFAAPRNLLWNSAEKHEINIFLDDDQVPKDGWLTNILTAIEDHPGYAVYSGRIMHYLSFNGGQLKSSPLLPKARDIQSGKIEPQNAFICNSAYIRDAIGSLDSPFPLEFNAGGEDIFFLSLLGHIGHKFFMTSDAIVDERWDISRIKTKSIITRENRGIKAYYKLRLWFIENGWKGNSDAPVVYGRIFVALLLMPLFIVILVINLINPFLTHRVRLNCLLAKICSVATIPWVVKWKQLIGRDNFDFR